MLTDSTREEQLAIGDFCHSHSIKLICANTHGVFGYVINYILPTSTTVEQSEVALSYDRVRRLYCLAVVFAVSITWRCYQLSFLPYIIPIIIPYYIPIIIPYLLLLPTIILYLVQDKKCYLVTCIYQKPKSLVVWVGETWLLFSFQKLRNR